MRGGHLVADAQEIAHLRAFGVPHELESLYSIADRMLFLDGEAHRPVALGAPAELARHAESAKVRDFLRVRNEMAAAHPEAA